MLRRIASDSLVYFAGSFFNQLSGFVVVVLLMRHFHVDVFGSYSYAAAITMLFSVLADAGVSQYIVREVNNGKESSQVLYQRFQGLQLLVSILMLGVLLIVAFGFNKANEGVLICLMGTGVVLGGYMTTAFSFYIAQGDRWMVFCRDVIFGASRLIFFGIGIHSDLSLRYFCATALFAQITVFVFLLGMRKRGFNGNLFKFTLHLEPLKKVICEALPYTLLTLVNVVYNKVDVIMLQRLSSSYEVGLYGGATQFVYPFMFISSALMAAIYPMLTRNLAERKAFEKIHVISTYILGSLGFLLSTFLFFSAEIFYTFFFANKYDESIPIYRILVWYLALVFFYGGYSNTIVARGGVKFLLFLNMFMFIANLGANVLLIPKYGALGAAYATIGCEIMILAILVIFHEVITPRRRGASIRGSYRKGG